MQPLHYDLRYSAAKDNSITHAAAATSNLDAAIPMRSAGTHSRNAKNYAHRNNHSLQNTYRRNQATPAAPAAHTRYLSSPAAATLHGKRKISCSGFLPTTQSMQHSCSHYNAFCSIPFITTSLRHHFPSSPLPFVTTSRPHHFPSFTTLSSSPPPIVTTSFITTSLPHHFPSFTTFSSSPLPIVTTSLHYHFPSSPLPFVTTCLPHHFPSSPLPIVIPSSSLHFVTTPLRHHFPSSPPCVIASYSFVMYCYVMYHPSSRSIPSGKSHS